MKVIIQRVLKASVTVDNQTVSTIGQGILVFAAVAPTDTHLDIAHIAGRILKLKMWDDPANPAQRWKKSVLDLDYQVLLVSQFTLLASTKKGNKPDFHGACPPALAKDLYAALLEKTRELYVKEKGLSEERGKEVVQDGVFGAMMEVGLVNDGPVTFEVVSPAKQVPAVVKEVRGAKKQPVVKEVREEMSQPVGKAGEAGDAEV